MWRRSGAAWCRLQQVRLCTQSTATTTMASYCYISEDQKKLILTMHLRGMRFRDIETATGIGIRTILEPRWYGTLCLDYIWLVTVNKGAQPFFSKTSTILQRAVKGYGFCEFVGTLNLAQIIKQYLNLNDVLFFLSICPLDHATAVSAVRSLNNTEVGGRPLRIDLADSDPFLEGKTTVSSWTVVFRVPQSPARIWWPCHRAPDEVLLASLPPGVPVPKGSSALDSIQTLASMAPNQLMEVLA